MIGERVASRAREVVDEEEDPVVSNFLMRNLPVVLLLQAPGLAGKRWSCVAAEDQDHRLLALVGGEAHLPRFIRLNEIGAR